MDAIGGQEMLMPVLTPFELWQQSGATTIPEIFRLQDRAGREYVLPDDARGDGHVPREGDLELPPAAAAPLPLLDQGAGRAALSRRASAPARVHHEGRVLVRPRRGGARRRASGNNDAAYRRMFERARARVLGGAGRVGDDGRQGVDRLPRAVGLGREHARHLRERRLRRRSRDRARRAARSGASRRLTTRRRRSRLPA